MHCSRFSTNQWQILYTVPEWLEQRSILGEIGFLHVHLYTRGVEADGEEVALHDAVGEAAVGVKHWKRKRLSGLKIVSIYLYIVRGLIL